MRWPFRQELEIPLSLSPNWQVALFSMYYTHSFVNAVLKSPTHFHCEVGYLIPPANYNSTRSVQLSHHQRYTHAGQVLQELIQRLGLYVMPALTGATTYHYGQMHMKPPSLPQFPPNPKLDFVEAWLFAYNTLPITYLDIRNYIKDATSTLMGADHGQYIWTINRSLAHPSTYAIDFWASAVYDLGESLALFMGFLELDPTRPGQTLIPEHNDLWVNTYLYRSKLQVRRLNYPGGLLDPNSSVCGVRINVQLHPGSVNFMKDKQVTFDMGAWRSSSSFFMSEVPYIRQAFPVALIALEPDRWLLQEQPRGYICFDHGVEERSWAPTSSAIANT